MTQMEKEEIDGGSWELQQESLMNRLLEQVEHTQWEYDNLPCSVFNDPHFIDVRNNLNPESFRSWFWDEYRIELSASTCLARLLPKIKELEIEQCVSGCYVNGDEDLQLYSYDDLMEACSITVLWYMDNEVDIMVGGGFFN